MMQEQQALLREVLTQQKAAQEEHLELKHRLLVMEEELGKLREQIDSDISTSSSSGKRKRKVTRDLSVSIKCPGFVLIH